MAKTQMNKDLTRLPEGKQLFIFMYIDISQ
jgi:hypothetical protein